MPNTGQEQIPVEHTRTQKHAIVTSVFGDVAGKSHQSKVGIKRLEKQKNKTRKSLKSKNIYPIRGNLLKNIIV